MKKINPNQSKYDYLYESLKNKMDNISLTFDKEKISAEEMFEAINLYAKMLHSKGVRKGDLIGVSMFNTPEGVYLLYALNLLGAIVVGFDPFGKKEDIKNQLELTKPKMVITVDSAYNKFKGLSRSLDFSSILYSLSDRISDKKVRLQYELQKLMLLNFTLSKGKRLNSLVKKDYGEFFPKIPYVSGELRDIIFTGGSTGIPKGVELNDYALNAGVEGMKTMYGDGYFDGMIYLGQIPFGYMSFGKTVMHTALTNGATYALTLKAFPKDFYDELVRTNASGTSGGPIHWTSFIEEASEGVYKPRSDLKPNSLKNLKLLFSGGEARREATIEPINRALEYCGCQGKIGEALGLTESYGFGIYNTGIFLKKVLWVFQFQD
ncbi:MAG: acyl--CoA ligase [Mollicutes bacterium]|nr:acyl--CoA ligase [Mollicutes bacterium]